MAARSFSSRMLGFSLPISFSCSSTFTRACASLASCCARSAAACASLACFTSGRSFTKALNSSSLIPLFFSTRALRSASKRCRYSSYSAFDVMGCFVYGFTSPLFRNASSMVRLASSCASVRAFSTAASRSASALRLAAANAAFCSGVCLPVSLCSSPSSAAPCGSSALVSCVSSSAGSAASCSSAPCACVVSSVAGSAISCSFPPSSMPNNAP